MIVVVRALPILPLPDNAGRVAAGRPAVGVLMGTICDLWRRRAS
jgi:hypothetical protein